ncbi:hypothetical protein KW791_03665 [Candidatus Parcubacteria bacterium]|nr:hypothetical protein [Candidatus Parcubacteria bacterium]
MIKRYNIVWGNLFALVGIYLAIGVAIFGAHGGLSFSTSKASVGSKHHVVPSWSVIYDWPWSCAGSC